MRFHGHLRLACLVLLAAWPADAGTGAGIAVTRHNLSVTGPGPVRSLDETEICIFCHAGHVSGAEAPLWNRASSGAFAYLPYDSPTLSTKPGQPDGASRLCLSCHDGTVALGAVSQRTIRMMGGDASGRLRQTARSNLGRDLSGSHPISMSHRAASRSGQRNTATRVNPSPPGRLLDAKGKVQCTSCHDAHEDPSAAGLDVPPFWRGNTFSEVCEACHDAPVVSREHSSPQALPQGCGSCHVGHGVSGEPLLPASEEEACYTCHGDPASRDEAVRDGRLARTARPTRVDDLFDLPYSHPVENSRGLHQRGEDLSRAGTATRRHVECADCHDTHGLPEPARPDRRAVRYQGHANTRGEENCFDCHGRNSNLPVGQTDKSLEFGPAAVSAHPVGPNVPRGNSPSLRPPWMTGDVLACSDCHNGGDGRKGPHGSSNPGLLAGNYTIQDGADESDLTYQVCYQCHDRGLILSDATFRGHAQHVVGANISCWSCHDSHASLENPGLIRFGKDFRYDPASPSRLTGVLAYDPINGTCTLSCHDVEHTEAGYR